MSAGKAGAPILDKRIGAAHEQLLAVAIAACFPFRRVETLDDERRGFRRVRAEIRDDRERAGPDLFVRVVERGDDRGQRGFGGGTDLSELIDRLPLARATSGEPSCAASFAGSALDGSAAKALHAARSSTQRVAQASRLFRRASRPAVDAASVLAVR